MNPDRQSAPQCVVPFVVLAVAACLVLPVNAEVATAAANFQSCVNAKIGDKKQKQAPSVDSLIAACQRHFDALMAALPPEFQDQAIHDTKHKLREKLR